MFVYYKDWKELLYCLSNDDSLFALLVNNNSDAEKIFININMKKMRIKKQIVTKYVMKFFQIGKHFMIILNQQWDVHKFQHKK